MDYSFVFRDIQTAIERLTETIRSVERAVRKDGEYKCIISMKVIDTREALPSNDNWVMALNDKGYLGLARYSEGQWYVYNCSADRNNIALSPLNMFNGKNGIVAWILI